MDGLFDDLIPVAPASSSSGGYPSSGAPAPAASVGAPVPAGADPFADLIPSGGQDVGSGTLPPLTIRGGRSSSPAPSSPASLAAGAGAPQDPAPVPTDLGPGVGLTDVEASTLPTPHPGGLLSNSADDGWLSGAAKGAATAVIKGAGDAIGTVGGLGNLADYLLARGQSFVTGKPLDEVQADLAARKAKTEADMSQSVLGRLALASDPTKLLPAPSDVSGPVLARTGEYVPTSEPGRIAQAGLEGAAAAFGPSAGAAVPGTAGRALVGALARQAPGVAAAGAIGQGATDLTGDPLIGLGTGLVATPLVEAAGSRALGAAGALASGSDLANSMPVLGPALQRARENTVAGRILASADDPDAVRAAVAQPAPAPIVPGSPQTFAGQIGNDQGLFEAEKALRNTKAEKLADGSAPTYFNAVDRAQSGAQVGALQGLQPTGDVFRPGQMLGQRMDAVEAAAQDATDRLQAAHDDAVSRRAVATADFAAGQGADLADRVAGRAQDAQDASDASDAARQAQHDVLVQGFADAQARQLAAAQDAAGALGPEVDVDTLGATLRGAVEQVRAGAKDLHRQLYRAVDPDGTLALVTQPVADRATGIMGDLSQRGGELTGAEAPLFRRAANLPEVAPYAVLHQLDTDVSAAMSGERRLNGESPALARLVQLKGAVKGAMTDAVGNRAAWEARQVDAGAMAPEDTIAARLQQDFGGAIPTFDPEAGRATGTTDGNAPVARAPADPGQPGAEVPTRRSVGHASGGEGLPAYAGRGSAEAPQVQGLSAADPFADLIPPERLDAPPYDPDGLHAPPRPDVPRPQDLRAFVKANGGMVDTGGDLAAMGMHDLIGKPGQAIDPDKMRERAAEAGYLGAHIGHAMRETTPNHLLDALSGDAPVHSVHDEDAAAVWDAYDEARERYDAARGTFSRSTFGVRREPAPLSAYGRDDIEGPGGPPLPAPANSGLVPNFDRAAASRLARANAAYADYARTYKNPKVGPGLRTTGYSGQYARGDAAFIRAAVKTGPDGYENARAFLVAARNDPDAVAAMHDAVLNPLRRMVTGNGTVSPAGFERWKSATGYGPALRAFDEVTPGFSSRFDDAAGATQSLIDLGQEHGAAVAAAQREALRQALLDRTDRKVVLGQAKADDKATAARLIAEREAADKAANAADAADLRAGKGGVKGILAAARATPAALFAKVARGAIAGTEVENVAGGLLKTGTAGAANMRALVGSLSGDADALAGLRRAGLDWIVRHHLGSDGLLKGGALINFLRDNRDVLRELYPHDAVSMMSAIARDTEINARWRTATAIKGGSDTTKNLLAALNHEGSGAGLGGHVTIGMVAAEAISQGFEHAGLKGAATGGAAAAVAYLANTLRQAGIRRTADLYREAMADPELARLYISRMPKTADSGALHGVARVLRRGLIVGPMLSGEAQPKR